MNIVTSIILVIIGLLSGGELDKPPVEPETHQHAYVSTVTPPACTEEGYTIYTCACGDSYTGDHTEASGHDWSQWTTVTEPSETTEGKAERTCATCGTKENRKLGKRIPSHEHSYTARVTKVPNCTEDGTRIYTCTCGDTYTEVIWRLGHRFVHRIKAPTCTENGYTTHLCKTCFYTFTDEVAALEHSYQDVVTAPTCTEEGYTTHTCSVCHHSYTETTAATGHDWSHWRKTWPTCTEDGYITYTCADCGSTKVEAGDAAYGHYYVIAGETEGKFIYGCRRCDDSYIEDLETRYDASLAAPEVLGVHAMDSYVSVNCEATFEDNSGYGYQCIIAKDTDFTKNIKTDESTSQWNGQGYVKLSFFYTYGSYYYKVRTYKMEGETFVYGPWSTVDTFDCMEYDKQREGSAQYSYEVYFLDDFGTDVYTEIHRPVYIKTDNPTGTSIRLTVDGESIMRTVVSWGQARYFDDVEYLDITDSSEAVQKVPGGYLVMITPETTGAVTVELRESNAEGYVVAKTFTLNVLDYDTTRNQWIDDMIAAQTDSSMTPKEKMDAIEVYLTNCGFRYLTNVDGILVTLAAQPNSPWFLSKRWDSATSPSMLALIAERIGGFEEIHNCFGDYPRGTSEWYQYHHMTYVVYEGQKYYYTVCPYTPTGDVGSVSMIDFSRTSDLTRVA